MNILDIIKKEKVSQITSDLIKIPSFSNLKRQEEKVAEYIYSYFKKNHIETWYQPVSEGRSNVIARIKGTGDGRKLMLSGHMDTVPAYDMDNPFSGKIEEGIVYGRGACDMKGPLAAMMVAMVAIKKGNVKLKGDLLFSALVDEEETGKGVETFIKEGPIADATIVGEPSNMNICLGHKGLEWIKVAFYGKKVHGGNMEDGANAINMAATFISCVEKDYESLLRKRVHPILGNATINIGTIRGGDQPSTVPDYCEITLDRRYIIEETQEQVYEELENIIEKLKNEFPKFKGKVSSVFDGIEMLPHKPFFTEEKSTIVESVKTAVKSLGIEEKQVTIFPAWSDAGIINEYSKSKCIIMGPGNLSLAHSAKENISEVELLEATKIYCEVAQEYCK